MFIFGQQDSQSSQHAVYWHPNPRMILARYTLAAPNSEPIKLPVLGVLMLAALGVSAVCAAAVFLFLLLGEQHSPNPESKGIAESSTQAKTTTPTGAIKSLPRENAAPRTSSVTPAAFDQIDFSIFRSRSYRAVGPVRVRLLRTKKSDACDIAVLVNDKRTKRLGATVGTSIEIAIPGSLSHATLVVTGIAKNRAWGYLLAPKSLGKPSASISPVGRRIHNHT